MRRSESLLGLGPPGVGGGNGAFDSLLCALEAFCSFSAGCISVSRLQAPKNKARIASIIGKRIVLLTQQLDIDIPSVRSIGTRLTITLDEAERVSFHGARWIRCG